MLKKFMREFLPSTNLYNVTEYSDANDQEEQIFWRDKGSVKKNAKLWKVFGTTQPVHEASFIDGQQTEGK